MNPARALVALIGAGLAITAAPADAATRTPVREHVEFHFVDSIDCGTFRDNYVDDYSGEQTTYFDSSGQAVRIVTHWTHVSTDTNSVTGLALHEHGHYTETDDLVNGTATYTGSFEVMNRPGHGVILADTGQEKYDADGNLIFFAGNRKQNGTLLGDAPYCEGLA